MFRVLKEKSGSQFNSIISEKITLVPGDISREDLGLHQYSNLREEMLSELDVVINLAATTNFDERYTYTNTYIHIFINPEIKYN